MSPSIQEYDDTTVPRHTLTWDEKIVAVSLVVAALLLLYGVSLQ